MLISYIPEGETKIGKRREQLAAKIDLAGLILAEKMVWEISLASFSAKIGPVVATDFRGTDFGDRSRA